jgi:hypothetical protein
MALDVLDSAQLFRFLSRPRTMKEITQRFGVTVDHVEKLLREAFQSGSASVGSAIDQGSVGILVRSGELLSFVPSSSDARRTKSMPKIRSRNRGEDCPLGRYRRLHFKFKESPLNAVKKAGPSPLMTETFKARERSIHEWPTRVSLSLEALLLDSLTIKPRTMMDLRMALGVSQRNLGSFERKGFVESFWGPKGVGRMFRITRKGTTELKRLKMASSIDRKTIEKPLISLGKIAALAI